ARTGMELRAPALLSHLAFTLDEHSPSPAAHVTALALQLGQPAPAPNAVQIHLKLRHGFVRFERHGEFYRIAIVATGKMQKGQEAVDLLPAAWVAQLPGKRIVAIHTHVLKLGRGQALPGFIGAFFGHEDLAGSVVANGAAIVASDFRIRPDGYTRMLVIDKGIAPLRLGRTVRRIHEIETYRMMALLGLPVARAAQAELRPLETELHGTIIRMTEKSSADQDGQLLVHLSGIARKVEELSNRTSYRFAATRAYATLVEKRVAELAEVRINGFQRLGVFLDRRFSPAIATCTATASRIVDLAARSERANNLLRTRVDIALEAQNQQLLRSMDARARQQLLLQETVEGLSVVAISYYLVSLFSKFSEGFRDGQDGWERALHLAGVPLAVGLVWLGLRLIRWRLRD
ncbi:MAG: DUF3422 domain-containing protein, partial [Alphaproteobacteria bacterium]|nr:DUF3422 domain-containing protein [Alphaproteobacteria bacterium]